jgi:hypothetical protein
MLSDVGNVVIFNRSGSVVSKSDDADVESTADSCYVDVRIYPESYRVIESSIEALRLGECCEGEGMLLVKGIIANSLLLLCIISTYRRDALRDTTTAADCTLK